MTGWPEIISPPSISSPLSYGGSNESWP
jgi:hypothetical protein